jgi:hypothetical protein
MCSTRTSRPMRWDKQRKLENVRTRPDDVWRTQGDGCGDAKLPPPPRQNRKFKNSNSVDTMTSKVLSDLPFSQNYSHWKLLMTNALEFWKIKQKYYNVLDETTQKKNSTVICIRWVRRETCSYVCVCVCVCVCVYVYLDLHHPPLVYIY